MYYGCYGYSGQVRVRGGGQGEGGLYNYASSARYLTCCFNHSHLAEQVNFGNGSIATIGLVNLQVSRITAVANRCSDKKYVDDLADTVGNGNLLASMGQS